MIRCFLLTIILCASLGISAQTLLKLEPASIKKQVVLSSDKTGQEEVLKLSISNPTQRTLRLRWDKEVVYQPYGWESQVCDKIASYPPHITSNYNPLQGVVAPIVLAPGESFDLYLNLFTYNKAGQCKIEIPFREISKPSEIIATAVFQLNLLDSKDAAEMQDKSKGMRVYPNPVYDRFLISNIPANCARIDVYNTLGRRIKTFDRPDTSESHDISDLPQGVYLLSIVDNNGKVIRTLRILHREFRP